MNQLAVLENLLITEYLQMNQLLRSINANSSRDNDYPFSNVLIKGYINKNVFYVHTQPILTKYLMQKGSQTNIGHIINQNQNVTISCILLIP